MTYRSRAPDLRRRASAAESGGLSSSEAVDQVLAGLSPVVTIGELLEMRVIRPTMYQALVKKLKDMKLIPETGDPAGTSGLLLVDLDMAKIPGVGSTTADRVLRIVDPARLAA